ncbi:MAG: GTP-binding protein, partial [Bacteroidales bacterium]|nr:GTP-binding protein [Bacteroidales bacterium]
DDDEHGHGHGHHHHHHHGEGEAEEYGIGTYVYYARDPMNINDFDQFVARHWPAGVIRAKGICYFSDEEDVCYLFEQAGRQVSLRNVGQWFATMPEKELKEALRNDATLARDWDPFYGDRMQKLVFIGQHLDKAAIRQALDRCLRAKRK